MKKGKFFTAVAAGLVVSLISVYFIEPEVFRELNFTNNYNINNYNEQEVDAKRGNEQEEISLDEIKPINSPSSSVQAQIDTSSRTKDPIIKELVTVSSGTNEAMNGLIVLIFDKGTNKLDIRASTIVATKYKKDFVVHTSLPSISSLSVNSIYDLSSGEISVIKKLGLDKKFGTLCVGWISHSSNMSTMANNMIYVQSSIDFSTYNTSTGDLQSSASSSVKGNGWSEQEARTNAYNKLDQNLKI
jgi:hypothetical protein